MIFEWQQNVSKTLMKKPKYINCNDVSYNNYMVWRCNKQLTGS